MPYSSQHEITAAVEAAVVEGLDSGNPITERDVEKQLMTSRVNSPPVDILIRTSGVKRLSDFLTWQVRFVLPTTAYDGLIGSKCSEDTQIQFSPKYWPEFGLWDFMPILFDYQAKIWSSK